MSTLMIEAPGLEAWAAKLNGAQGILADECRQAMERATTQVQTSAREVARKDTLRMVNNLTREVTPFEGKLVSPDIQGIVMNNGRRPGAAMPPAGALLGWMERHGIPPEMEFVIRRKIAEKGIPGDQWLTGTFARLEPAILAEFATARSNMVQRLRTA